MDVAGIPAPGSEVVPGVTAAEVLRVMQPALQRLTVELKQSLRFTLEAAERPRVTFRLGGPARSIGQLERLLADQIEADVVPSYEGESEPSAWLDVAQHCGCEGWDGVSLGSGVGEGISESAKPFWSGVAAALLVMVAVGVMTERAAERVDTEARAISQQNDDERSAGISEDDRRSARAVAASMEFVGAKYGVRADLGGVLRMIAEASVDGVGVESLSAERSSEETTLRLRARASGQDANDARAKLQGYISLLNASPLTAAVTLGSVRIVEEPAKTYATFDATVSLFETAAVWLTEEDAR